MKNLEHIFEGALWQSRFVVLFAVIVSLATAFVMFFVATVDAWFLVGHMFEYMSADLVGDARASFRSSTVTHVVEIIDGQETSRQAGRKRFKQYREMGLEPVTHQID